MTTTCAKPVVPKLDMILQIPPMINPRKSTAKDNTAAITTLSVSEDRKRPTAKARQPYKKKPNKDAYETPA